jgi:MraZ protein
VTFRGTFDYSLDAKNRLTVPAKLRGSLSDGAVLSMRIAGCIALWRREDYAEYVRSSLEALHPLSTERETLERYLNGGAADVELDSAGRVMVPAFLVEHAKLDKDVVVMGVGQCLELWSPELWRGRRESLPDDIAAIQARLSNAG